MSATTMKVSPENPSQSSPETDPPLDWLQVHLDKFRPGRWWPMPIPVPPLEPETPTRQVEGPDW
jgi:hypothetical protein